MQYADIKPILPFNVIINIRLKIRVEIPATQIRCLNSKGSSSSSSEIIRSAEALPRHNRLNTGRHKCGSMSMDIAMHNVCKNKAIDMYIMNW